jgi:hypothetical protein
VAVLALALLCGCATASKRAKETVFEVSFYSPAQNSSPLVSLRGDNKLFVVWVKPNPKNYDYDGKFLDIHRDDAAFLEELATDLLKWAGTNATPNCTNGVLLTLTIPGKQARKEICVTPGRNRKADELFASVNELLPEDQKILWR